MISIRDLCESGTARQYGDGKYFPALPIMWGAPFPWRLKDAWEVLRGRAVAVNEADRSGQEYDG